MAAVWTCTYRASSLKTNHVYLNFHLKVWDFADLVIEFFILHMNSGYNLDFGVNDLFTKQ